MLLGKLVGAALGIALGLAVGNPLGLLLLCGVGLLAGHLYDDWTPSPARSAALPPEPVPAAAPTPPAPPPEAEPQGAHESYALLGVAPEASDAAVRRAFRRLAAQAHPDRVVHLGRAEGERATRRFQELQRAYAEIRRLRGR